ncbi:hypothetical protein C0991_010973, partial [Blastosporella zonata]
WWAATRGTYLDITCLQQSSEVTVEERSEVLRVWESPDADNTENVLVPNRLNCRQKNNNQVAVVSEKTVSSRLSVRQRYCIVYDLDRRRRDFPDLCIEGRRTQITVEYMSRAE